MINSANNLRLIKLPDGRGFSFQATKKIKFGEILLGVPGAMVISSFDQYPWTNILEPLGQNILVSGRLVFERFARFDPNDHISKYVHSLPSEVDTPSIWGEEDFNYLLSLAPNVIDFDY